MQKYIIVTGGTKGIGRAVVMRFARAGFAVVTCARSAADLLTLAADVEEELPGSELYTLAADLSQPADTRRFTDFVLALGGKIEVLINNTGAFTPGRLQDDDQEGSVLRHMIDVNLYSTYDVTRALLPSLLAHGGGHIFTMCSVASLRAYPSGGAYSVAKFALLGLTKALREELKEQNIRVTAVLPGATLTASWEGADLPPSGLLRRKM
ncbi:SDR family oxidoreductase [Hymenobacter sp. HDW8]|uniref:SDR family NAD(P)-dependent oxidoreductase n=1 Tax=Hymenobacter sp. HDW8 TaxID=2714932 RepID=UPI00293BB92E|nr:SDR family oxidoreductase [Hymenobacter sp. HDW8]